MKSEIELWREELEKDPENPFIQAHVEALESAESEKQRKQEQP